MILIVNILCYENTNFNYIVDISIWHKINIQSDLIITVIEVPTFIFEHYNFTRYLLITTKNNLLKNSPIWMF